MTLLNGVAIRGISTAVPVNISKVSDYSPLTEKEREKFSFGTGIYERRIVSSGQCASDLCISATKDLMANLNWDYSSIEALVMITQTGDYPVPATSIIVQNRLGLSKKCATFDVNLGCSSYPYGLAILSSFMKIMNYKRALLLVGDVSSLVCAYTDKSAWPLFGDAGSATALELDNDVEPMSFDLNSDGSGSDAIIIKSGGLASRNPPSINSLSVKNISDGIARADLNLQLRGADIFSFAISRVPQSIFDCMAQLNWNCNIVDYFVLHQANRMINETIRKKIGYSEEKSISTLDKYGNTSSASIPLSLSSAKEYLRGGEKIVLSGFGVGLSWATCCVTLPKKIKLNLFEDDRVYST